jgi:HEAT repeat protein
MSKSSPFPQMKNTLLQRTLLGGLLTLAALHLRAADEQELIATLQSNASAPQKWSACQDLRLHGTATAVPALAALLTDERLSQAARLALERLPYPEAGAALRDALGQTSGLLKVGVIDSLGWRGEPSAIPLLTPLLSDTDTNIATAAAASLGRLGGHDAVTALSAARDQAPAAVQPAVLESLLKCAEQLAATSDDRGAAALYRELSDLKYPVQIRTAAWRGLALSDADHRTELIQKALEGADRPVQLVALKLLRQIDDPALVQACLSRWNSMPTDSQMAILDARVRQGPEALPTVRTASRSPDPVLRTAAWQAFGELNDSTSVAALAKAAAEGTPAEREAARDSLARLRGQEAREAILAELESSEAPEKAELLRALGERDDRAAVNVLLKHAASHTQSVRLAALESLTRLSPQGAVAPLLDIAVRSENDEQRDPVLKALYAVCDASPNKEEEARNVVASMERFPAAERRQILPLLSELATPDALAAAEKASHDPDPELAKEAVRVLGQWPTAVPAPHLLALSRSSTDPTLKTLALRGAIEVAGQEPDTGKRLALLREALSTANGTGEKKQALGQIGQVPTRDALELALASGNDADLANEADLAAISIAEKLAPSDPKLADQVAAKVLEQVKEGEVARRAWALRIKPSSGASFIRDWMVSGPYRQPGIVGATAVFGIAFGPEKPGQEVDWKAMPPSDHANLGLFFPGAENCAAYLRTRILAPHDSAAVLLIGSDDGVKAWLNGQVVHSNNVDRGEAVDQDSAPIRLQQGANDLMLKITQGGGGWSASVRIIGTDGKPIPGLMVERPATH